jgi:hypothetical protein
MHGDEVTGFVLLLRLIHHLLHNYGEDDEITFLLDNMEIWICPNENPDGTYTTDNSTINGATRTNARNVDLNRNYPNPVTTHVDPIQMETRAMIRLTDSLNFVMSANIHGGFEVVNFPFDSWLSSQTTHADHQWWKQVSHEYADTARFYSPAGYMNPIGSSFTRGVAHGGDWYVIYGSRQDYMNYYAHQRELTLELSKTKMLPPDQLPAHWDYNYRSLINFMKQAKYGIRGTVTDYHTGEPIQAKIFIPEHDQQNSWVYSGLTHGDFYRPILAGTYNLEITAPGYETTFLHDVKVADYTFVFKDIRLVKEGLVSNVNNDWQIDSTEEFSGLKIFPNPASGHVSIQSSYPLDHISVHDISGRMVLQRTPDSKNTSLIVSSLQPGVYFLIVKSGRGVESRLMHVMGGGR